MIAVQIIGWVAIVCSALVAAVGAWTLCGELLFRARWKWGDAHQLKRSVHLGWNTGIPPEDVKVLVREHADSTRGRLTSAHCWAVMTRHGDKCYSPGLVTPITNVNGWLEIDRACFAKPSERTFTV